MELWQSLPEDFRVTIYIGLGATGLLLAIYLVGRLLTWGRDSILPGLMVVGGMIAIGVAISLYLDQQPTLPGIVEGKTENIAVNSDGEWSHDLYVRVRYTPPERQEPSSRDLRADAAVYDRVSAGDSVEVRHLHLGGWFTFSRLSERSTLSILLGTRLWLYVPLAAAGLLLWLSWKTSQSTAKLPFLLAFVALLIFVFLIDSVPQWRASRPLVGDLATAVATVHEIERFTEVGGGPDSEPEALLQPFDLVQVQFVPEDRRAPVLAADMIDADSLPMELGGTVTVQYRLDDPRTIRLSGGTRSYVWKNTLWAIGSLVLILLLFGGLWWWGARKARAAAPYV